MCGTLRKVVHKYLEIFEIWCWKRGEKISWTDRVKNLHMNCLLKHLIEGKLEERLEVKGRRSRRSKKLLDNLKEEREYWKLKEKKLDSFRFG